MSNHPTLQAVILAGGLGTRLRSVVSDRPKVLAEVGGQPFIVQLLRQIERAGVVSEVILCTGFMAEEVRNTLGSRFRSLTLIYSTEPQPLGTAGALRNAMHFIRSDTVLVLNGDSYCGIELNKLVEWHTKRNLPATMVLVEVADTSRYGTARLAADNRITRFEEKGAHAGAGLINGGIYLFSREVVSRLSPGQRASLELEVFPKLAESGLYGYLAVGCDFIDIGIPEDYTRAKHLFA